MLIEIGCGHTSQGEVPAIILLAPYGIGRSVPHGVENKGLMDRSWGSAANVVFKQNGVEAMRGAPYGMGRWGPHGVEKKGFMDGSWGSGANVFLKQKGVKAMGGAPEGMGA